MDLPKQKPSVENESYIPKGQTDFLKRPSPAPRYIEAVTKNPKPDTSFLMIDGAVVGVTLKKR